MSAHAAPGDVNAIFTKALIPFLEREAGADAADGVQRITGRPRAWLTAEYNWLPLAQANALVRFAMEATGEADEDRWARRFAESFMDWKPSREERAYIGTYTMALGSPREVYERIGVVHDMLSRLCRLEVVELRRRHATVRLTPRADVTLARWACTWLRVMVERFPTNWNLPRARVVETQCAAVGAPSCVWEIRWTNPSLGYRFWTPAIAGAAGSIAGVAAAPLLPLGAAVALVILPAVCGAALGIAWLKDHRHLTVQRLRDLEGDEVLYSNRELEKKFRDLETTIEQLSLLTDLGAAVNATLDPEKIYEQALQRLVHRMGYQSAHVFVVDHARRLLRRHQSRGELAIEATDSVVNTVASTGLPVVVNEVSDGGAAGYRALLAVPLRVKEQTRGVVALTSREAGCFSDADVELVSAVANHVAVAVERAESFHTIEELTRGLEEKVRLRTEELRAANDELASAYDDLKRTQMQLVQREKMASVGQLVAGVAHELNNPIGFVFSNVVTLEDFVGRLRAMLDTYRGLALAPADRARAEARWTELKVEYALRYLDAMIHGIREGAERARKIVGDLRVFARTRDDVWQSVDLHDEIESSLTLLNHLLKDRVTVERRFGTLPPVECVRSEIDQVFLNLLANAAQAIVGQGRITIATRADDATAVVEIADTGPGIPADIVDRVFDPFFTTKPVGEGTGLGLSISYEIVKKHGGELGVSSSPGAGGATFTVRIPLTRVAR